MSKFFIGDIIKFNMADYYYLLTNKRYCEYYKEEFYLALSIQEYFPRGLYEEHIVKNYYEIV